MRRRLLATCRWHVATAGLFRRKANPPSSTSSSQASYRLRRLFLKSPCTHSAAAPFQTGPASLGSGLARRPCGRQYGGFASVISLAMSFFIKTHRALILMLLASKSQPLCWVVIWCAALWAAGRGFCKRHIACGEFLFYKNSLRAHSAAARIKAWACPVGRIRAGRRAGGAGPVHKIELMFYL